MGPADVESRSVSTPTNVSTSLSLSTTSARVIESHSFVADASSYDQLIGCGSGLGKNVIVTVERTELYGRARSGDPPPRIRIVKALQHTDRRDRRLPGKSDTLDAENAARTAIAGDVRAVPKSADGTVEMMRLIKVAKDNAVEDRTSTMIWRLQIGQSNGWSGCLCEDPVEPGGWCLLHIRGVHDLQDHPLNHTTEPANWAL